MESGGFEGFTEQPDHCFRPILLTELSLKGQFAQQVRVAEGVGTFEFCITFEAIVHEDVPEAWQHTKFLEGDQAALGMHREPTQGFTGEYMQPVQSSLHPSPRLVRPDNWLAQQGFGQSSVRSFQVATTLFDQVHDGPC